MDTTNLRTMHPRAHCPPDVEPAAYVRVLDAEAGGCIPVTLHSAQSPIYSAWAYGEITGLTITASTLRRWLAEGKAVRTLDAEMEATP